MQQSMIDNTCGMCQHWLAYGQPTRCGLDYEPRNENSVACAMFVLNKDKRIAQLEAKVERLRDVITVPGPDGIRFGKYCWISHDKILIGSGPIVRSQYDEWVEAARKALEES